MTCYYPLDGYWLREERRWCRHLPLSHEGAEYMAVPCGQCIGCRLERARQWGVRCEHEMSLYDDNCFITLTYDDAHLPVDGSIDVRVMQLFMKRLRKHYEPRLIKSLYCGEYGEENWRPHYHAILFNLNFEDRKPFKRLASGFTIDTSAILSELWPYGFSSIGAATFESAAYCASYCLKKITGERADDHYRRTTPNGTDYYLTPEFAHMSRGIGAKFLEKFERDIYPANQVVSRGGQRSTPPRYYAKKFAEKSPEVYEEIMDLRREAGVAQAWNSTPERLAVREQVLLGRLGSTGKGRSL